MTVIVSLLKYLECVRLSLVKLVVKRLGCNQTINFRVNFVYSLMHLVKTSRHILVHLTLPGQQGVKSMIARPTPLAMKRLVRLIITVVYMQPVSLLYD